MTADAQQRLRPIAILNQLPSSEFATAVRPLFEAAGPLEEALYTARPYRSYEELIDRAESIAARLPLAQQIEIVNAHPRIGEDAAVVRGQSRLSYREQGYDREVGLPAAAISHVYAELAELNRTYEDRFGFRFVIFVNKRPKSQIVDLLRDRLHNVRDAELETALGELFSIARERCHQLT
jgi:2-oxo-4-hydroxy-4-carboxy--5-ureidoimidazoline (OHCU) decarboxylase